MKEENIGVLSAGERFGFKGFEWIVLDNNVDGGVLAIMASAWNNEEYSFDDDGCNNYAIGIDKGIAWEWVNRCTTNPARTDFIKKVQKVCALYREGLMQDGKVNPVTGIFWQKNYDGMKDQTEMVLTPNNPLGDSADTEALARKYLDNADIVDVPEGEISEVAERAESPKIK